MWQDKSPRSEYGGVVRKLMDTALGRMPADLLVTDAWILNVFTGELLDVLGVSVKAGKIVYVVDVHGSS